MSVEIDEAPAIANGNGNGEERSRRISSFKRAIAQIVDLSPDNEEADLVTAVRSMVTAGKAAFDSKIETDEVKRKLKALRKKLLLMAVDEADAD